MRRISYIFNYAIIFAVTVAFLCACQSPKSNDNLALWKDATVSLCSWEEDVIYIREGERDFAGKSWKVEDSSSEVWLITDPWEITHPMLVTMVSTGNFLNGKPESYIYTQTNKGEKCSKNVAAVTGNCLKRAGGVNFYMRKNVLGYSLCEKGQPTDVCNCTITKLGVWEYYGRGNANCSGLPTSIVANKNPSKCICIP